MISLVVGGTSGLGLELAKRYQTNGANVTVTGRRKFEDDEIEYIHFDLTQPDLPARAAKLVADVPKIDTLIYAAGYFQDGRITDLSDEDIENMLDVGGRGLIYLVREILGEQGKLAELITITSTSQWTPREREPIYNYTKAGAAHLSHALAKDERVGKVLVVGPAGMKTDFWRDRDKSDFDDETYNDPGSVADEILKLRDDPYSYRFAKILRDPMTVEIVETEA